MSQPSDTLIALVLLVLHGHADDTFTGQTSCHEVLPASVQGPYKQQRPSHQTGVHASYTSGTPQTATNLFID